MAERCTNPGCGLRIEMCLGHAPPPEKRRCMMIVTGSEGLARQCPNVRGSDVHQTGPRSWTAIEDAQGAFCKMHSEQLASILNGYNRTGSRYDLKRAV